MKIAIVASASGNGKTTLARQLAARLDHPWLELDALVHGPNWTEIADDQLRAKLAPFIAQPAWIVDGSYMAKVGDLILDAADLVIWLDLPIHVWLPRLARRSARRITGRESMWNGNRETLRGVLWGLDSLFVYALRIHFKRRRTWPARFAGRRVVRLRTRREVDAFVASLPAARRRSSS